MYVCMYVCMYNTDLLHVATGGPHEAPGRLLRTTALEQYASWYMMQRLFCYLKGEEDIGLLFPQDI